MEAHKIGLIALLVVILVIVIFFSIFMIILFNSPGKPKPFTDRNGNILENSISEKGFIEIDGKQLWFFIKSKNKNNPVLLYLHGGMPDYFLTSKFPTNLEDIFTVVWWDQRGAGLSYEAKYADRNITIEDLLEDTRVITEYLKNRFSQDKIFLMAHSGGTYLGIKVIEKYPELYEAYIGVAQISYQKLSEKLAYEYMLREFKTIPSKRKIAKILADNPVFLEEPLPEKYIKIRDKAMHYLGIGTMKNMRSVFSGIFVSSLLFREYSIQDKINLWKGKAGSGISVMWDEISTRDLSKENTKIEIPVYIFHGIYDYTCSYELSKQYFENIEAPLKKFFTFYQSAHSPIFEEPDKCIEILESEISDRYSFQ